MIIAAKPFDQMTLPELREEYLNFYALLWRTAAGDSRARVAGVCDLLATWIARREREAREMAA